MVRDRLAGLLTDLASLIVDPCIVFGSTIHAYCDGNLQAAPPRRLAVGVGASESSLDEGVVAFLTVFVRVRVIVVEIEEKGVLF